MKSALTYLIGAVVIAVGLGAATAAASPGSATAKDAGFTWSVQSGAGGSEITVTSPKPIVPSNALLTIRRGDVLIGVPKPVGDFRTYRLSDAPAGLSATGLSLWKGEQQLSAADIPAFVPGTGAVIDPPESDGASGATDRGDVVNYDPTRKGPYSTRRLDIDLGLTFRVEGMPAPIEDVAEVTYPVAKKRSAATGKFPVVLLLHGRHAWCYAGGEFTEPWPCAPGSQLVPSYLGYRYMSDRLATQGFVVISISADGINAQDNNTPNLGSGARTALINHHLMRLLKANKTSTTAYGSALRGRVDMSKVLLMGHSRGGEGVVAAAQYAQTHRMSWSYSAVLPLAPTDYGALASGGTPLTTVLPACDGDVENLMGQMYADHGSFVLGNNSVMRTSAWFPGGNHNYFNTQWTPGLSAAPSQDDSEYMYGDTPASGQCQKSQRLTPARERAAGLSYITNVAQAFLRSNAKALPYLDGRRIGMPSSGGVAIRSTPTGGAAVKIAGATSSASLTGGMRTSACEINSIGDAGTCLGVALSSYPTEVPHWVGARRFPDLISSQARRIQWDRAGATALLRTSRTLDLTGQAVVGIRLISDPDSGSRWALVVRDTKGRQAKVSLTSSQIAGISTGLQSRKYWAQWASASVAGLRKANPRLDLRHINAVGVQGRSAAGKGWVLDAWTRRNELVTPGKDTNPQASIAPTTSVTLRGSGTVAVPITVNLTMAAQAPITVRVALTGFIWGDHTVSPGGTTQLTIGKGRRSVVAYVPVPMSRAPGDVGNGYAAVFSVKGAESGSNWVSTITATAQ
ncbi:MAG: hypothetical protein WCI74_01455 [Actinomycetes bacterium]